MPDMPDFPTPDDEDEKAPDRQSIIDRILGDGDPTPG